jgi:iron complex outermembrane receptor protein
MAPRDGSRDWTVASPRISLSRHVDSGAWEGAWSFALSRGFVLPTTSELFAYPGFGSNPDLDPTGVLDLEAGWSGSVRGRSRLSAVAFWMEVRDEVFFDQDEPGGAWGRNVGRDTRRAGLEISSETALGAGWGLGLGYTWLEATFREGWRTAAGDPVEPGDRLPLVPRHQAALWVRGPLPAGWELRLHGKWVDERPMDNDPAGLAEPLPAFHVWNLAAAWVPPRVPALSLRLDARNLMDERYATRGIAQVPDEHGVASEFFTPAPGRSFEAGLRFRF